MGYSYGFEPGAAVRLNTEKRFWLEVTPTLRANMGDNQIAVVRIFDARGNGGGHICPTITGDHQNRITDYTAVVVCTTESEDTDMSALEKSAAPFRHSGEQGGAIHQ